MNSSCSRGALHRSRPLFGAVAAALVLISSDAVAQSDLSTDNGVLYWKGNAVRLVGYSDFDLVTRDGYPRTNYLRTAQLNTANPPARHGVNLQRVFALGYSNTTGSAERMPFQKPRNSPYKVGAGDALDDTYLTRLNDFLTDGRNNGHIVQLTLFDAWSFRAEYRKTPWHPDNNNMWDTCPGEKGGLPKADRLTAEFYKIFNADSSLNCLGLIEKNYVVQIVNRVKTGGHRHVLFEVMNEATISNVDKVLLGRWHRQVAKWIKDVGGSSIDGNYLVSVSLYPGVSDPTPWEDEVFEERTPAKKNVDIVAVHCRSWKGNICGAAMDLLARYGKPVIIDDDGTQCSPERDNNDTIKGWATTALGCSAPGAVHFNHLDGITTGCTKADVCLDCNALEKLGDAPSTRLDGITGQPGTLCAF